MTKLATSTRQLQDELVDSVRQTQRAAAEAVGSVTKTLDRALPAMSRLKLEVPTPRDVVGESLGLADTVTNGVLSVAQFGVDLTQKLLDSQRSFARELFQAAARPPPGHGGPPLVRSPVSVSRR
jgi:hypothetical protein